MKRVYYVYGVLVLFLLVTDGGNLGRGRTAVQLAASDFGRVCRRL
jgi:hypothetical protein